MTVPKIDFRVHKRFRTNNRIPPGALPCESSWDGKIHFSLSRQDDITPEDLHRECDYTMRRHDAKPRHVRQWEKIHGQDFEQ